jgi:hypothetical protein
MTYLKKSWTSFRLFEIAWYFVRRQRQIPRFYHVQLAAMNDFSVHTTVSLIRQVHDAARCNGTHQNRHCFQQAYGTGATCLQHQLLFLPQTHADSHGLAPTSGLWTSVCVCGQSTI